VNSFELKAFHTVTAGSGIAYRPRTNPCRLWIDNQDSTRTDDSSCFHSFAVVDYLVSSSNTGQSFLWLFGVSVDGSAMKN